MQVPLLPILSFVLCNRSSFAGLALLAGAIALIAVRNRDPTTRFDSDALQNEDAPRLNAKSSARFAARNEAEALSMLRCLAEQMANGKSTVGERELRVICKQLSDSSLITLLNDPVLWPAETQRGEGDPNQWARWLHLNPLRVSLLESLAALDVEQALAGFGSETALFIKAAASADGPHAFQAWMNFRKDWRNLEQTSPVEFASLGDVGLLPTTPMAPPDQEQQILASLIEGWASVDPDSAWHSLFQDLPGRESAIAVGGLFKGLEQDSEWAAWGKRLGELEWPKVDEDFEQKPECLAAVGLASRWIRDEPEEALAWLDSSRASWNREGFEGLEAPSFEWGTTGRQEYMSAHAFVIYEWLNEQPAAALSWLSRADPVHRPDTVMEDVVKWARIPPMEKIEVIQSLQTAQSKERAALQVAWKASRSTWLSPEHRAEFAQLKKALASVNGIRESVKIELLGIGER